MGGLFYLLTALLMPFVECLHIVRGQSSLARWRRIGIQVGLAIGILAGLWATAWTLDLVLPHAMRAAIREASQHAARLIGVTPTRLSVLTLGALLLVVESCHLLLMVARRARRVLRPY